MKKAVKNKDYLFFWKTTYTPYTPCISSYLTILYEGFMLLHLLTFLKFNLH